MRLAAAALIAAAVLPFTAEARGLHMSGVGAQSSGAGFQGGTSFDWRGFGGMAVPPDFDLPEEPSDPLAPAEELPPAFDPVADPAPSALPVEPPAPPPAEPPLADPVAFDPPADPGPSGGVGDQLLSETPASPDEPGPAIRPDFDTPDYVSPRNFRGSTSGARDFE